MFAQRIITDNGKVTKTFQEKCICGNPELTIEPSKPTFATCKQCLRVVRRMVWDNLPDGKVCEIWGTYFDPYIKQTIAGQFLLLMGADMPEERYPS